MRPEDKKPNCRQCDGLTKESKAATIKKKKKSPTCHFKWNLADVSTEDLRTMKRASDYKLKKRISVEAFLTELSDAYRVIDWDYLDWKTAKAEDAVRGLEGLAVKEAKVRDAILTLTDVEVQWDAALSL